MPAAGAAVGGTAAAAAGGHRLVQAGVLADLGEQGGGIVGVEVLATRAGLGHDVVERFHLLGHDAAGVFEHAHARRGRLDREGAEHAGDHRHDRRGRETEDEGERRKTHGGSSRFDGNAR